MHPSSICYHLLCLTELDYKNIKSLKSKAAKVLLQSDWTAKRSSHSAAFSKIKEYVKETLIENRGVKALSDIYAVYNAIFEEEELKSKQNLSESAFQQHHFLKKLQTSYFGLLRRSHFFNTKHIR